MAWVRLDDAFPDNPKVVRAGDAAAWLFVCGLTWCNRQRTDGRIPQAQVPKLTGHGQPRKLARALVAEDLWHEPGHDCDRCEPCPEGEYLVHDYLQYQPSRAEIEAKDRTKHEAKVRAGRKGAAARWGKPLDPDDDHLPAFGPDGNPYDRQDGSPIAEPMAELWQGDGRPHGTEGGSSQAPASEVPWQTASTAVAPNPNPHVSTFSDPQPPRVVAAGGGGNSSSSEQRAGTALAVLVERDLAERQQNGALPPLASPEAWRRKVTDRRTRSGDLDQLRGLADQHPDAGPEALADMLEPPVPPPPPSPADSTVEAQRQRAEAGAAKARKVQAIPLPPDGVERVRQAQQGIRDALRGPSREQAS